jgi:hypothetical protein
MARQRKTRDVYEVQGHYGFHGWECVTAEETRAEAKQRMREYLTNEPGIGFRIVKKRERIQLCQWFALCDHEANGTMPHPVLGEVPICDRCRAKIA